MLVEKPGHSEFESSATQLFYAGSLTEEQVQALSRSICSKVPLGENHLCAVFGYGSQPTSKYRWLSGPPGVEVVWHKNFGPWWLSPLLWIAASRGGLVVVEAREQVATVLDTLGSLAMVELISCPGNLREPMTEYVQKNAWRSRPGKIASDDASYFCFGFDGDSCEEDGGFYTWCSIGCECPAELIDCLAEYIA